MKYAIVFICLVGALLAIGWWFFRWKKNILKERSKNMVFLRIIMARKDSGQDERQDTIKDFREQISIMEQLLASMKALQGGGFTVWLLGQESISFEYIAHKNEILFYVVVPKKYKTLIEKQIVGFYPDSFIDETSEVNIFQENQVVVGEILRLKKPDEYPIRTYQKLETDGINALLSAMGRMNENTSAAIQFLMQPVDDDWQQSIKKAIKKSSKPKSKGFSWNPFSLVFLLFSLVFFPKEEKDLNSDEEESEHIDDEGLMKEKAKKTGYLMTIRVIVTARDHETANVELSNTLSAFSQFASPAYNRFTTVKHKSISLLIQHYVFRQFVWWQKANIFNIEEIATLYHFPHSKYNKQPEIRWQYFKFVKAPKNIPTEGLYLGDNIYRGETKKIYISHEDRFRHFYIIGQTGTGKSSILTLMARQDLRAGRGIGVLDPHGDFASGLLDFIPKSRAEDLVYFDPSDLHRPMGLNLLEASTNDEKQLVVVDALNIMIKLFGNEVFGPRIQDYFRNGCLTLMDYPEGGTIVDIMKLFTDENFQRARRNTLKDAIVKAWWDHTYSSMGDREKAEIIPYFAAKFGQFITNSMMRNIVGQAKSAFNVKDIMDGEKILLMSISKGVLGDLNSSLLGMILVSKIQIAAMRRQQENKEDRKDFFLYIDEFQNYVTDSIESILSEARKYRLGLIIAHQYIAQLQKSDALTKSNLNLKDAVFGNVGSILSYKIGPEDAEMMTKQFAPTYSEQDFVNMDKFQAAVKIAVDGKATSGFSLDVPRPWLEQGDHVVGQTLRELSRLQYGREREFVEKEIIYRIS